ncbi:hypothetical protein A8F94_14590 [Bacillus sp. FJAT-27225]|nr:hypothetical protein A8F94_14590 [Bacillus sp. FJAT-27225]
MNILNKKVFTSISVIYVVLVIASFFIWAFSVQEPDGTLDVMKYIDILLLYIILGFFGVILAGISFAALKEETAKIGKRTIISGLFIGFTFLVWRTLMNFY